MFEMTWGQAAGLILDIDHALWGQIAGFIALVAFIVYGWSQLRGGTTPNRATWIVWAALGSSLAISSHAAGAIETIWVILVQAGGPLAIAVITIWYGEGGLDRKLDRFCIAAAVGGLAIMWCSPTAAVLATVAVDLVGAIPTYVKAIARPQSESRCSWTLSFIGCSVNLLAIKEWSLEWSAMGIATYPVYLAAMTGVMAGLLWVLPWARRRTTLKLKPAV